MGLHDTDGRPLPRRSGAARQAAALAAGTVVAGVAAYAYTALGTRTYGAEQFAPIAVIWSLWPAAASAFALPLEQWIVRELSLGAPGEARVRAGLRWALPIAAALCVVLGLLSWAAGERLFGESSPLHPALLTGVSLGAVLMGVLRGGLGGRGRFLASAVVTAGENLLRVAAAAAVVLVGAGSRAFATVLMVGPLVGLAAPTAFRFGAGASAGRPLADLSSLAAGSLLAQLVLSAPPVLLAAFVGATAGVTAMFVALAVTRAPYLVAVGVSVRAVAGLTRLVGRDARRAGVWLRRSCAATAAAAVLAALCAPTLLAPLLRLIFGPDTVPSDLVLRLLAAGVVGAHGALAASVVLLAIGRQRLIVRAWLLACAANAAALVLPVSPDVRVTAGFVLAELVAVTGMTVAGGRQAGAGALGDSGGSAVAAQPVPGGEGHRLARRPHDDGGSP